MKLYKQMWVSPEEEFPKVEKMLYNLAWKFSKQYNLPFEDMRSIAYEGFMKACGIWRPNKGMKFSTQVHMAVWGCLKSHIMMWAKKNKRMPLSFIEIDDDLLGDDAPAVADIPSPKLLNVMEKMPEGNSLRQSWVALFMEAPHELLELTQDLSSEAQEMMALFLEAPEEIVFATTKREQLRQIKEHLSKRYPPKVVDSCYHEICGKLQEAWA